MIFSKQSNRNIAIFLSAAMLSAVSLTGCGSDISENNADQQSNNTDNASDSSQDEAGNYGSQNLVDDNGNEYTLTQNSDGTETARYNDGQEVTMRRHDDGSIDFVSGAAGLIGGLAAGYLLFHGLGGGSGAYNASTHRYIPSTPYQQVSRQERDRRMQSSYVPSSHSSSSSVKSSSSDSSSSAKSNSSSSSSVSKGGFGSVGARSAAS